MNMQKVFRYVSFVILGIYLSIPFVLVMFFKSVGSLGLTFFGEFVPLTLIEGMIFGYSMWFIYTGIPAVICIAVALIIWLIIWKKSRSKTESSGFDAS